jgi:hypothetical protein
MTGMMRWVVMPPMPMTSTERSRWSVGAEGEGLHHRRRSLSPDVSARFLPWNITRPDPFLAKPLVGKKKNDILLATGAPRRQGDASQEGAAAITESFRYHPMRMSIDPRSFLGLHCVWRLKAPATARAGH